MFFLKKPMNNEGLPFRRNLFNLFFSISQYKDPIMKQPVYKYDRIPRVLLSLPTCCFRPPSSPAPLFFDPGNFHADGPSCLPCCGCIGRHQTQPGVDGVPPKMPGDFKDNPGLVRYMMLLRSLKISLVYAGKGW